MNNEPVAWMTHLIRYDNLAGKIAIPQLHLTRPPTPLYDEIIPLYTHPVKELNDGGEPVKNATYWKRQYNLMATQNDNLKSGLYHANEQIKYLESHPVKEEAEQQSYQEQDGCPTELAVLQRFWRKAQEK